MGVGVENRYLHAGKVLGKYGSTVEIVAKLHEGVILRGAGEKAQLRVPSND